VTFAHVPADANARWASRSVCASLTALTSLGGDDDEVVDANDGSKD
jgi:hypothetical protein